MKTSRDFEELLAYFNARSVEYLGRDELIRNKRSAGRAQDLADLEWLQRGDSAPD